jgi:hypothetical protein
MGGKSFFSLSLETLLLWSPLFVPDRSFVIVDEEDEGLAKKTAVLALDLITNGLVGLREIGTQAQGFAIDYVDLEEAAQLLNTLVEAAAAEEDAAEPEVEPEPEPVSRPGPSIQDQDQGGHQPGSIFGPTQDQLGATPPTLSPLQHQSLTELIEVSGDYRVIPALEYARLLRCEEELRLLKPRL